MNPIIKTTVNKIITKKVIKEVEEKSTATFNIEVEDQCSEITVRVNGTAYISIVKSDGYFTIAKSGLEKLGLIVNILDHKY
jgi:hypothetical protein